MKKYVKIEIGFQNIKLYSSNILNITNKVASGMRALTDDNNKYFIDL